MNIFSFLNPKGCPTWNHKWKSDGRRFRVCTKCGRREHLEFYSNYTSEWVKVGSSEPKKDS
jgi:hypothetical protein